MQPHTHHPGDSRDIESGHEIAAPPAKSGDRGQRPRMGWMLRQIAHLASGNAVAIGTGMVTLALMAHMLGPALLGVLAMVEAYGRFVDQVIRLETWQAIIRYGAVALEAEDEERFAELVGFGIALDIIGAIAAGAVALLAIPLVGDWIGWGEEPRAMAGFYAIAVAFGISSTPTGILRLFERFAIIAWIDPALAVLRLIAVVVIWVLGGSIWELLVIAIAVPCLQRVTLAVMAWRELRRRGYRVRPRFGALFRARGFDGIWAFIISANGTVLVRKSTQELDLLAVGAVAGPIGAGIYQLVRKLTLTAMKAGAMLQQVAFPDLARLWARRDLRGFTTAIRQVEALTLAVGVAFVIAVIFAGDVAIRLIAGPEFEDAATPLVVQSVAALLFLSGSALRPALMTMGMQPKVFCVVLVAGGAFFATLYVATPALGVSGAGVAHIVFNLIWLAGGLSLFVAALRRQHAAMAAEPERAVPAAALRPPVRG